MPDVDGDLEGLLPVLHADHVGDDHDVVVDVVADRLGTADRRPCSSSISGAIWLGRAVGEAERAEAELAPALPNVGGLAGRHPHGGVGRAVGLREHLALGASGSTCPRRSTCPCVHIFGISAIASSPHGRRLVEVVDVEAVHLGGGRCRDRCRTRSGCSMRWSSRATVSATRTGWFTFGVMLKMAEPTCTCSVMARPVAEEDLGAGHVAVLVEEVVLGAPHVLERGLVGGHRDLDVAHDALVLGHSGRRHARTSGRTAGRRRRTPWDLPPGQVGANAGDGSTKLEHVLVSC